MFGNARISAPPYLLMNQSLPAIHSSSAERVPQGVVAAGRRLGAALVSCACAAAACLPVADLSSYSEGAPAVVDATNGGASPGARAAERDSDGDAAAPRESGESVAPLGEVPLSAPRGPAGSLSDAGVSSAEVPCDSAGEIASLTGACYLLSGEVATWGEAGERCRLWGGALASPDSPEEDAFVAEQVVADTWIGLNDRAVEGVWVWDANGEEADWDRWAAAQPDDFGGNEDCVEWRVDGGGWNDRPCDDLRAFLCER